MIELLADNETVILDSGTTCLEVAHRLSEKPLTVMPLSLRRSPCCPKISG